MLTHRGPDEAGLLVGDGVAFGHLRLSIVDLASGQQPMSTHDGRYWTVYNGEIFNHVELRQELESLGHVFRTRCDTEVLLNAFREWGVGCLNRFNGQWAFALWDSLENSFFLSRDRWGVRPLFYALLPDRKTIAFASEIKALLADDRIPRQWDVEALRDILICWVSEFDRTMLASARQLLPGEYMWIKGGVAEIRKWWELDYSLDSVEWSRSEGSWAEELRWALQNACQLRLRADVPVGSYLSGGLDSAIIASLSAKVHRNRLKTFSISFSDAAFDESTFQRLMADYLGTEHDELKITREAIAGSFDRVIWHAETPVYRTAPAPMMHLARRVKEAGFKVVLTGEGADELFGGYDQFKEDKVRRFWALQPNSRWRPRLLEKLTQTHTYDPRSRSFLHAFYHKGMEQTQTRSYSHRIRWLNGASLLSLVRRDRAQCFGEASEFGRQWTARIEAAVPEGFDGWLPLSKAQYWETRQLLSRYLLSSQGDRMSMAHGVEGRYPFLDPGVYAIARRMPPNLKLKVLNEKYILKKTFAPSLPTKVVFRRKYPYRAPDALALYQGAARDRVRDSLCTDAVERCGMFDPDAVQRLITRIENRSELSPRDNMAFVIVYSAQLFHELFIERQPEPKALPALKVDLDLTSATCNYGAS